VKTLDEKLFSNKPSVQEFKNFIKKHPKLITAVRNNERTWKDTYEEWFLLGEDHDTWKQYKDDSSGEQQGSQAEMLKNILGMVKNVDMNQLQNNISQVSGAISSIQEILQTFQKPQQHHPQQQQPHQQQNHPFSFRKD
jgi:hypothetical protein